MNKLVYEISQLLRRVGVKFHELNDARVQAMRATIHKLGGVNFGIELFPDGSWAAESTNLDGIITGGTSRENMNAVLKDAVFTYFEIPPHLCEDSLVNASNEPVTLKKSVYA